MKPSKSNSRLLNSRDKMSIKPLCNLFLSAFLSVGATGAGWAMTSKLAGDDAAVSFLYLSLPIVIGVLALQTALFLKIKNRAQYLLLFNIFAAFGVLWMMSCLVLPLFWMQSISVSIKILTIWFSCVLFYLNVKRGSDIFRERWKSVGESLLGKYYRPDRGVIDWIQVVGSLKLHLSVYIPGIPQKSEPILTAILVTSMLLGLSFRKVFPEFSVFAWGIPSIVCIATILQMTGSVLGQILILRDLEKKGKKIIRLCC